jgi:hypothetical protein
VQRLLPAAFPLGMPRLYVRGIEIYTMLLRLLKLTSHRQMNPLSLIGIGVAGPPARVSVLTGSGLPIASTRTHPNSRPRSRQMQSPAAKGP